MVAQEGWLISGDWGTTTLRLRVVRAFPFQVVEEVVRPWGAASVHEEWEASSEERVGFYLTRLFEAVKALSGAWDALPIYISGMASSSVGIQELAYAPLPFDLREALPCLRFPASRECPHPVTLFTGLRWESRDVMRGEETQVIGLAGNPTLNLPESFVVLLPGTHSKHVNVEAGRIVKFQTFLTGDLYEAIARHTMLRHSLAASREVEDWPAFREGLEASKGEGLLGSLFQIRCADLMGKRGRVANDAFLSGLLVGAELERVTSSEGPLVVANDALGRMYAAALKELGPGGRVVTVSSEAMNEAVPRAHALVHHSC